MELRQETDRQAWLSRRWWIACRWIVAGALQLLSTAAMATQPTDIVPTQPALVVDGAPVTVHETMQNDAALYDVIFIDRQSGWAVGERGAIWRTADGGQSWQLQPSGVTCRLDSVCFLDELRGCAVGGSAQPYSQTTRGVVLSTVDGGNTWQQSPQPTLPALRQIKFFDTKRAIVIGAGTSVAPSGVFTTHDGGQTWQPLPADVRGQWLAGDFIDTDTGAVAGMAGQFATIIRRHVVQSRSSAPSLRSYRALQLASPRSGWLVGDGGLVMTTADLGNSWQSPPGALPLAVSENFDFQAVAFIGPKVWVAGSPGTRVFHSPDGGRSWQSQTTGQQVPIRDLFFVDETHGWAVGDLGTIVATHDGGRTWQSQRQGGKRAALLALFARETNVPLELLAKYGGEEGYLAVVDLLQPDANSTAGEAVTLAGATAADTTWLFALPEAELAIEPADLFAMMNAVSDQMFERLESRLVRKLRMWRPEVVVTDHAEGPSRDPLRFHLEQMVARAVAAAADPTQYPELSAAVGLPAWQVKRVYGVLSSGSRGDVRLSTGQFAPRLGKSLADWAGPARALLDVSHTAPPDMIELQLLSDGQIVAAASRDLFNGIHLAPGGEARRRLANLPTDDIDGLRRLAARRRQMKVLLERSQGNAAWTGQVANLLADFDDQSGGELLYQLADGYRATDRLDLAADTFSLLARRWPDHPLVEPALTWLIQFYSSSETAHRTISRGATNVRGNANANPVQQASAVATMRADRSPAVGLSRDDRLRRATMLGDYLEKARPELHARPSVRFPLVVAQRQLGYANPAKRYFLTLGSLPNSNPWYRCAETEKWFTQPEGTPPLKALGHCRKSLERPHLDGRLDEPLWESADRLRLEKRGRESFSAIDRDRYESPAGEKDSRPLFAEVRLAYDHEFLYLAIRCPKVTDGDYAPDDRPRSRDADLTRHDRVTIKLDVDRDYTTAFELTVDHRGWTHDACWGNAAWDPAWYVAAESDEQHWTVEAAIPIGQLVAKPPAARHVWAVAARRTIPRVGYESWEGDPADDSSPDQFGLVIFQ